VTGYRTLAAPVDLEIPRIKRSRFLAYAAPVSDDAAVRAHLDTVRKAHHAARHVCWARVLGRDGADTRARDAGEPGGSAGRPILAAITGRDLTFTTVAVVRYFGGTKLGVGGLARAYGGAAAAALDRGRVVVVVPSREVHATVAYGDLDQVRAFARRREVAEHSAEFGASVDLAWRLPEADAPGFVRALLDATDGRVRATASGVVVEVARPAILPAGEPA